MNIDVLLVDDDCEYAESLKGYAMEFGVNIYHVSTLEKLKKTLPTLVNMISVIILDIKGKFKAEDEFDDQKFLTAALQYLDTKYNTIPRVVLTGDTQGFEFANGFFSDIHVFRKGNESEAKMFAKIVELHDSKDTYACIKNYEDVFEVFSQNKLPISRKDELVTIILNKDSSDITTIKNSLSRIRDIQEEIMAQLVNRRMDILPTSAALNGRQEVSFTMSHRYLKDNMSESVNKFSDLLELSSLSTYRIGCKYGVHTNEGTVSSFGVPSKYSVNSTLNALFDLIIWYGDVV